MNLPWMPTKGVKTRRLAEARLRQLLFHQVHEDDTQFLEMARRQIPDAWLTLEMDLETTEPKEKVTLYLDRAVAKMFRAMGAGYQERINRILQTWMQLRMAELVEFEMDMLKAIEQAGDDRRRPLEDPEHMERRQALHEHWAYLQGVLDASVGKSADP